MRARSIRTIAAALFALAAGEGLLRGGAAGVPTRDAFESERRRVAALETEMALASTRKPYLVLDLEAKTLRYRLLGMTLREVPLPDLSTKGLVPAKHGTNPDPPLLAGIFTVREKDGDPRLNPLTPEQVEAGADDENVANILPPEPPKAYRVQFKQPVVLYVSGPGAGSGLRMRWASVRGLWDRLRGGGGGDAPRLELSVQLDEKTGAEVYRSLIPDLRCLVLPPRGFTLPQAGQEPPPKAKPPRAAPQPPPKPLEPPGVPFQIPAPQEEGGERATVPEAQPQPGASDEAPAPAGPAEPAPAEPAPAEPAPGEPDPNSPGGGRGPR
ncbi:MAG TPA: hypothetical protein VFB95_06815 [Candidatus Cryosericum sp.]|nr:hypothetical protein [Candidatus Cryosericum sp.]